MRATQHSAVLALIGLFAASLTISSRAAAAQANPGEACCGIVSINANGVVSARQADGRVFQFQVNDKTVLASLHIGQPVWADFGAKQVTLKYGGTPCCGILGARPFGPVDGARPVGPVDGARPAGPVDGARPAGPVDGARPFGPVDAARPASPCCSVVVNGALTGRLGRLVVAFPAGANAGSSRVDVFKAGETASLQTGYGAQSLDLLPGTYSVVISGARVEGVSIQSGHDTRLRVGVLRINAGASTRADVLAADGKTALTNGYGAQVIGLPVGTYRVQIAGGLEAVTIQDGKITEF